MSIQPDRLTGSLIRGYQFRETLGQGAFATVYRAQRQSLGTDVAIKVIHHRIAQDPLFLRRFEHEARLISRLKHPFITSLYDYWRDERGAYMVIAYFQGGSLRRQLEQAPLSLNDSSRILDTIASALDYAHRNGVLHRDIKPNNILFDAEGHAYLADFGIAKDLQFVGNNFTETGRVVGTINYCSPEQLNAEDLSPPSDIFALGITLYEMLSREHPFPNISSIQCATHLIRDPLPKLDFVNDMMNAVIQKATAKAPSQRYASALDMAVAFRQAAEEDSPKIEDLTTRELEVLQHLADGMNNDEIAEAMFITRTTVNWYLRQIYPKLAVENRAQAIIVAHQHHLIFRDLPQKKEMDKSVPELLKTELRRHNLPATTGGFIGRKEEIARIAELITEPKSRLITILAPGGMGKTALAIEVARQQFERFRDGVYLVELSAIEDAQQIPSQIAEALDYQIQASAELLQQVLNYLQYKQLLLILDNFEHLLDGSPIVSQILKKAPEVQILITSRERLNLRCETVFSISGLGFPNTVDEMEEYESPDLFVQELRRIQPNFELNTTTAPHILHICKTVEGMPLALILASAWGEMLSVKEISDEIEKGLDFLAAEMPDIPSRHWDIRAMLNTSWERLSETEQDAFMKMSIFYGGCTREAAETVTGASLRTLTSLLSKALLKRDTETGRFSIHELLRQYAEEQLHAQDLFKATQETHFDYYSQLLIDSYPKLIGHEGLDTVNAIEADFENHLASWDYAVGHGRIEYIRDMALSFHEITNYRMRRDWNETIQHATDKLEDEYSNHPNFAMLLFFQARLNSPVLSFGLADADERIMLLEKAVKLVDVHHMNWDKAFFLTYLAFAYVQKRRMAEAWQAVEEAIMLASELNDPLLLSLGFHRKGYLFNAEGDYKSALENIGTSLSIRRKLGCQQLVLISLSSLAFNHYCQGDIEEAMKISQDELVPLCHLIGNELQLASLVLINMAAFLGNSGDWENALKYWEESIDIYRKHNLSTSLIFCLTAAAALLWIAGQFDLARTRIAQAQMLIPAVKQQQLQFMSFEMEFCKHYFVSKYQLAKDAFIKWLVRNSFLIQLDDWLLVPLGVLNLSHTGDEGLSVTLMAAMHEQPLFPRAYDNRDEYQDWLSRMKVRLGQDRFDATWERGAAMGITQLQQFLEDSFGGE